MSLISKLGKGTPIDKFIVEEVNEDLQIQEVYSNAIIVVYSFDTHKKVTIFAPSPERIMSLYEESGEITPSFLIEKSEDNVRRGLTKIDVLK